MYEYSAHEERDATRLNWQRRAERTNRTIDVQVEKILSNFP